MINKIWGFFIISGIVFCFIKGDITTLNNTILSSSKNTLDMIIKIFPVMALWLGIMNIASTAGLLKKISKFLSPLLGKIFKDIPKNNEAISCITANLVCNMFGLGNASTPFGLKAMKLLQEINDKKDTASNSMITFLVLNTSGLTIIPTTVISLRMMYGSKSPTSIVFVCIISTFISLLGGLLIDKFCRGKKYD